MSESWWADPEGFDKRKVSEQARMKREVLAPEIEEYFEAQLKREERENLGKVPSPPKGSNHAKA